MWMHSKRTYPCLNTKCSNKPTCRLCLNVMLAVCGRHITMQGVTLLTFDLWRVNTQGRMLKEYHVRHKSEIEYWCIHVQKTCCIHTFTLPEKPITCRGFWHDKRMREKTRISYLCFGKWCACATSLYLWPYTCSAHYVAGRGRVIPLKVTYHVTKNLNNTGRWSERLHWQKTSEISAEFQKITLHVGGFFDSGLECLGEVA